MVKVKWVKIKKVELDSIKQDALMRKHYEDKYRNASSELEELKEEKNRRIMFAQEVASKESQMMDKLFLLLGGFCTKENPFTKNSISNIPFVNKGGLNW